MMMMMIIIIIIIFFSPHDNYTVYRKMSPFIYSSNVKKRNQCTQYIPVIATVFKSIYNFTLNVTLTYTLLRNFSR